MPPKKILNLQKLKRLIEKECLPHWQVAEKMGCHEDLIYRRCKELGLKTQRTGPRGGDRHPCWKGGRIKHGRYVYLFAPQHPSATKQGYVAEHRLKMEKKLGRLLHRQEVVHHVDGNPENNAIENLEVFPNNAAHLRYELKGRVPNWTEAGKASIQLSSKKTATRLLLERGGFRRIQTKSHPPSKP